MNRRWITVAAAIVVLALIAGTVSYVVGQRTTPAAVAPEHDALAWLRDEFNLSGEKLARVEAMHAAYATVCADHCRAIAESRKTLRQVKTSGASAEAIRAAETTVALVDALCVESTAAHIREVAAVIGGAEGERYLAMVLPRVKTFDHAAPATLDMNTTIHAHDHAAGE